MSKSFSIDPRAYSGGIVNIKAPNFAGYYQQFMAHQMAKQQAIGQYYDRLQNNINPAGVRSQDLDGWNQKADAWQKFGMENRDKLVNARLDGGKALNQFQAMHRELLSDTDKSRRAAAMELEGRKNFSALQQKQRATSGDLKLIESMGKSIYDPGFYKDDGVTPHDASEFSVAAPPLDASAQQKIGKIVTAGLKPTRTYGKATQRDYAAGTETLPFTEQHSKSNLQAIAERTGDLYDGDTRMQSFYQNQALDPDRLDKLRNAYKTAYGDDDLLDGDGKIDHRKVAMADQILKNNQVRTSSELHSVPRIPVGRGGSGSVAGQQYQAMTNWVRGTASAIRNGDQDELGRMGSQLYQNSPKNPQYKGVEFGGLQTGPTDDAAGIKQAVLFHHDDHQYVYDDPAHPEKGGGYKDVHNTTTFTKDDPDLEQKLAGLYQLHFGKISKLANTPFYQDPLPSGQPAPTSAPQPALKTQKPVPIDPDALIKQYQPK